MKNGEITISGQISETCTGTPLNLYRYRCCSSQTVPVQVRAVLVQVVPTALVFAICAYLS